jgi:hypothetical protein
MNGNRLLEILKTAPRKRQELKILQKLEYQKYFNKWHDKIAASWDMIPCSLIEVTSIISQDSYHHT